MLRVLLVDPSREFRTLLRQALEQAEDVEVVDAVAGKDAAVADLKSKRPDVVVMDVELPKSLEIIREVHKYNEHSPGEGQVGVILIAQRKQRDAEKTIQALESGAFDFVLRPETRNQEDVLQSLCRQLFVKMRNFSSKRIFSSLAEARVAQGVRQGPIAGQYGAEEARPVAATTVRAVLMGVSTGGPKTLAVILPELCRLVDLPVCVVQHMPRNFTASLAESLNAKCGHTVREVEDGELLSPRMVYIAPGGLHLAFARSDQGVRLTLRDDPPEDGCKPSVNVLFRSAAEVLQGRVVAAVLTGMGSDGAKGVQALKKAGAPIFAQDKASSVVWGMPGSAVATGCVDKVLSPRELPAAILAAITGGDP